MYCKECGNVYDQDSNFCKHCGLAIHPNNANSKPVTNLSDNGFLLIALLTLLPNIIHLTFKFLHPGTATKIPFAAIELSFLAVLIAQFVLLVLLTKNKTYRIIIIIIGIICLLLPVLQLVSNPSEATETYTIE